MIVIIALSPFCTPHHDIDHDSMTLLWISLVSVTLGLPPMSVDRIGKYGRGQVRGLAFHC